MEDSVFRPGPVTDQLCADAQERSPESWTADQQAILVRLAADGATATVIGVVLGKTRNAVLGRAHRTGVTLPMTKEKRRRAKAMHPLRPRPAKVRAAGVRPPIAEDHPMRQRGREFGARAYTDVQVAAVLAARFAGASRNRASKLAGCSWQSVRIWERKPELAALGRELLERATAEAARRKQAEANLEQMRRGAIAAHNAPILARLDRSEPRVAQMARAYIAGLSAVDIADEHSLTRERIGQILARAAGFGVDFDGRLKRSAKPPLRRAWERPEIIAQKRAAALELEARVQRRWGQ